MTKLVNGIIEVSLGKDNKESFGKIKGEKSFCESMGVKLPKIRDIKKLSVV